MAGRPLRRARRALQNPGDLLTASEFVNLYGAELYRSAYTPEAQDLISTGIVHLYAIAQRYADPRRSLEEWQHELLGEARKTVDKEGRSARRHEEYDPRKHTRGTEDSVGPHEILAQARDVERVPKILAYIQATEEPARTQLLLHFSLALREIAVTDISASEILRRRCKALKTNVRRLQAEGAPSEVFQRRYREAALCFIKATDLQREATRLRDIIEHLLQEYRTPLQGGPDTAQGYSLPRLQLYFKALQLGPYMLAMQKLSGRQPKRRRTSLDF